MKMYILVKESIPLGFAITAVAHAAAAAMKRWPDDSEFIEWNNTSFKKVICKVTDKELDNAVVSNNDADFIVMTESILNDEITAIVFKPRKEWPKAFKFFRLYK